MPKKQFDCASVWLYQTIVNTNLGLRLLLNALLCRAAVEV
jgi:hypothetical protein